MQLILQSPKLFRPVQGHKSLWAYVAIAFNRVDGDRLQKVGADRLCAEWILKNGGGVQIYGLPRLLRDYNALPPESAKFKIQAVDGTSSSVMKIGLEHFKNCDKIERVIFHNCKHLEEDGLEGLAHLSKSLKELQVSGCYNLHDGSFNVIGQLKNLQKLTLFDLKFVKNLKNVQDTLQAQLPNCRIELKE